MPQNKNIDPLKIMEMAALGMTAQETADALGVDRSTVYYHAADMGVRFARAKHGAPPKVSDETARKIKTRRDRTGESWAIVGKIYGVEGYAARRAVLRLERDTQETGR